MADLYGNISPRNWYEKNPYSTYGDRRIPFECFKCKMKFFKKYEYENHKTNVNIFQFLSYQKYIYNFLNSFVLEVYTMTKNTLII